MRTTLAIIIAASMLGGCASFHPKDKFGYEKQPWTIAEAQYDPPVRIVLADKDEVAAWCTNINGHISFDGLGCARDDGGWISEDCKTAEVKDIDPEQLVALHRWLDAICQGWRDKWVNEPKKGAAS